MDPFVLSNILQVTLSQQDRRDNVQGISRLPHFEHPLGIREPIIPCRVTFSTSAKTTTSAVDVTHLTMPLPVTTPRLITNPMAVEENRNHFHYSEGNRVLRARRNDRGTDRVFVILRAMNYLARALKRLDIPFAITGDLVGYEYRIERFARKKITVLLLSHGNFESVKTIENTICGLSFDDGHILFHRKGANIGYLDSRVPYGHNRLFCDIQFISFPKLDAVEKLHYSRLLPSPKHGWLTTSPTLVVLKTLNDVAARIGRSRVPDAQLDQDSAKALNSLQRMIGILSPGEAEDQRLVGEDHIKSLHLLSWRLPNATKYLPLQPFLKQGRPAPREQKSGKRTAREFVASSKMGTKATIVTMKQQFSHRVSDASPALKSLHYIAKRIAGWFNGIASLKIHFAVGGCMASSLYGVSEPPRELDIILFVSPSSPLPGDAVTAVKQFIMDQDAPSFKINKDGVLSYAPPRSVRDQTSFKAANFAKKRCIINIILPQALDIPHLTSAQITVVEGVPVIPFELHLLHKLKLWDLCRQNLETRSKSSWKDAAREVLRLLDASHTMAVPTSPLWQDEKVVGRKYLGTCRTIIQDFVGNAPGGRASVPAWIRLGILSSEAI